MGLDERLVVRAPHHGGVVAIVPAGAPFPLRDPVGRKARGAFDTPEAMAHRAVACALRSTRGAVQRGLDPGCGTGTFLLALEQAGIGDLRGEDLDPAALAVARVVVPAAQLHQRDGTLPGPSADVVVGNPPFVPPERQDKAARAELRARLPWLHGRFDLAVPFAWLASERLRDGGGLCLVLPAPLLVQPYGRELRRRWLERHRLTELGEAEEFPGARVKVCLVAFEANAGPAAVPPHGIPAEELLALPDVPLLRHRQPGDDAIVAAIRAASMALGDLCEIDTGVVVHGASHRREDLVHDEPAPGLVPYADARDLRAGRRRWLDYQPALMHRAKRESLFAPPKLLVPRVVAGGAVRAWIDRGGLWVGHTVNVVRPRDGRVPLEVLARWLTCDAVRAVLLLERGMRMDLYPRDLRALPVPVRWLDKPSLSLAEAWGLDPVSWRRLQTLGHVADASGRPKVTELGMNQSTG